MPATQESNSSLDNVPLREIYDHWYWGRLFLPNHTFLYSVGQASESLGHVAMSILVAFKGEKLVKLSTHIDAEPSEFEVDELTGVKYPRKLALKIDASNIKGEVTHMLRKLADSFMFPQAMKGHGFLRFLAVLTLSCRPNPAAQYQPYPQCKEQRRPNSYTSPSAGSQASFV